jgi:hypothetical protein
LGTGGAGLVAGDDSSPLGHLADGQEGVRPVLMTNGEALVPDSIGSGTWCKVLHPIILHDYSTNGLGDYPEAGLDAVGDVVRL